MLLRVFACAPRLGFTAEVVELRAGSAFFKFSVSGFQDYSGGCNGACPYPKA